jgi:hypothetical protein
MSYPIKTPPTQLSDGELIGEIEWLNDIFDDARLGGHGISTGETVAYNIYCAEATDRGLKFQRR